MGWQIVKFFFLMFAPSACLLDGLFFNAFRELMYFAFLSGFFRIHGLSRYTTFLLIRYGDPYTDQYVLRTGYSSFLQGIPYRWYKDRYPKQVPGYRRFAALCGIDHIISMGFWCVPGIQFLLTLLYKLFHWIVLCWVSDVLFLLTAVPSVAASICLLIYLIPLGFFANLRRNEKSVQVIQGWKPREEEEEYVRSHQVKSSFGGEAERYRTIFAGEHSIESFPVHDSVLTEDGRMLLGLIGQEDNGEEEEQEQECMREGLKGVLYDMELKAFAGTFEDLVTEERKDYRAVSCQGAYFYSCLMDKYHEEIIAYRKGYWNQPERIASECLNHGRVIDAALIGGSRYLFLCEGYKKDRKCHLILLTCMAGEQTLTEIGRIEYQRDIVIYDVVLDGAAMEIRYRCKGASLFYGYGANDVWEEMTFRISSDWTKITDITDNSSNQRTVYENNYFWRATYRDGCPPATVGYQILQNADAYSCRIVDDVTQRAAIQLKKGELFQLELLPYHGLLVISRKWWDGEVHHQFILFKRTVSGLECIAEINEKEKAELYDSVRIIDGNRVMIAAEDKTWICRVDVQAPSCW